MTWLFEAQPPIAKCSCPAEGFTRTTLALSRSEGAGLGVERLPSTLYVQSHRCNDSNDDDADDHNDEDNNGKLPKTEGGDVGPLRSFLATSDY